jgi:hypothetical protein
MHRESAIRTRLCHRPQKAGLLVTVQEWPHAVIRAEPILNVMDRTSAQSFCRWVGFEPITYNMSSAFPIFGLWEALWGSLQKQFPRKTQNICFGFRIYSWWGCSKTYYIEIGSLGSASSAPASVVFAIYRLPRCKALKFMSSVAALRKESEIPLR